MNPGEHAPTSGGALARAFQGLERECYICSDRALCLATGGAPVCFACSRRWGFWEKQWATFTTYANVDRAEPEPDEDDPEPDPYGESDGREIYP